MLKFRFVYLSLVTCVYCFAQREPVLKQIDLPHPYYFREMYLPLHLDPSSDTPGYKNRATKPLHLDPSSAAADTFP